MSDTNQKEARDDEIIEPVRPFASTSADRPQQSARPKWLLPVVGVSLVVGLIVVVLVLPRLVPDPQSAPKTTPIPSAEPASGEAQGPVLDPATQAKLKQEAEALLTEAVNQESSLQELGAPVWGGDDWAQYEETMRAADLAFIGKEFGKAMEGYREVMALGDALIADRDSRLAAALDAGRQALESGQVDNALASFQLALDIDPENALALSGIEQANVLAEVLAAMDRGDQYVQDGDLNAALKAYQDAVGLDDGWQPAREALAKVRGRIVAANFESAMSSGLSALNQEAFKEAEQAFRRALKIRPGAREAEAGLAQAQQGRRLDQITVARTRGKVFEDLERWSEAMEQYQSALEVDPSLAFALEGLERSRSRASLDAKLTALLDAPSRLFDPRVLRDSEALIAEARNLQPAGARLTDQLDRLQGLIRQAATPIAVQLSSDGLTDVTLFRVGKLGAFVNREINLRPGNYTAVGSRDGFRDVRETFKVRPGAVPAPVDVRCTEPI